MLSALHPNLLAIRLQRVAALTTCGTGEHWRVGSVKPAEHKVRVPELTTELPARKFLKDAESWQSPVECT